MPELPEIETIRMQLQKVLVGQKLAGVTVNSKKTVRSDLKKIVGGTVETVERKGKVLLIVFGEKQRLGIHFKMTGQLIYEDGKKRIVGGHPTEDFTGSMPSKHTRVVMTFDKGILYFNDQRLFGWVEINPKFVENLGPEPFEINADEFGQRVRKSKRPIKLVLMEQTVISGVGNIYANDGLWEAKINPRRGANTLTRQQMERLYLSVCRVLREGIEYGGATAADAKYVNLHGLGGHYQEHFRVYDREGEECLRGDGIVHRFSLGGRGTYFCPSCQK